MWRVTVIAAGLLIFASLARADEKADRGKPKEAGLRPAAIGMKIKLEFAKTILEGLAVEDYAKLEEGARAMRGLNDIEGFVRSRSPAYTAQLNVFRLSTDALVNSAEEKNLDGAALAFTQMTVSCVNCHKILRGGAK